MPFHAVIVLLDYSSNKSILMLVVRGVKFGRAVISYRLENLYEYRILT